MADTKGTLNWFQRAGVQRTVRANITFVHELANGGEITEHKDVVVENPKTLALIAKAEAAIAADFGVEVATPPKDDE